MKHHSGRYRISNPKPVDIESLRRQLDEVIASGPDEYDLQYGNECCGNSHSTKCPTYNEPFLTCIMEQIDAAQQRKKKLDMLHLLTDRARRPWAANGLRTLEGMVQESCVYELEYVSTSPLELSINWLHRGDN